MFALFHISEKITDFLLTNERHNLIHWFPVGLGIGIGSYFALPVDPPQWAGLVGLVCGIVLCVIFRRSRRLFPLLLCFTVVVIGFVLIQQRTSYLATPMLQEPLATPLKLRGRVLAVEQQPGSLRLTIDEITYKGEIKGDKPTKIRILARGRLIPVQAIYPGQNVKVIAMLLPPRRPVMPGAYDFRRKAYFDGIGAVGYVVAPIKVIQNEASEQRWWKRLEEQIAYVRHRLTLLFRTALAGQTGEIAAALVTGDRSGITNETRQQFADSGIAHILAISGLHLSIVSGLVFLVVRGGLSFVPAISLRLPIKKLAAVFAMVATTFYLLLCGATVPAQRAKIQTTIILTAILIDRQAITMRNVALAATAILIMLPESIISVSFQLSFAAVVALVAGYQAMQPHLARWYQKDYGVVARLIFYLIGISYSSILATAATTPFIVYTFHKFTLTAVLTNLIAIPLVSFVIMPLLVLFLLSTLFSLEGLVSVALGFSIDLMINLAASISTWSASLIQVPAMPLSALLMATSGMLWLSLWTSKVRRWGSIPLGLSLALFCWAKPPDLYINEEGTLVAWHGSDGKGYVNTLQAGRFARKCWSEAVACQSIEKVAGNELRFPLKAYEAFVTLADECKLKLTNQAGEVTMQITAQDIAQKGGHSLWVRDDGFQVISVQDYCGQKPWSCKDVP